MSVKQISVFVENKKGRLAEITAMLANNNIDISALSIADTTDFGILRLIVNNPDLAQKVLKDDGLAVKSTDVIAIGIDDVPGGLAKALDLLNKKDISIEYMYAFVGKSDKKAIVVIKTEMPELAVETLSKANIKVLTTDEVYGL
mgnify:CR=1 FL=1